ncbi:hypothetical protein EVAR_91476_1 [Eumeta japonica]|uniref:Uncharacterized protein n=1 Tax=Eumeta variegata TaxID=151549 RepID=A0A4C1VE60_EUMVA|nr:hypothetical protein EVAR_91476_1 [Eumeta japonica]
MPFAEFPRDERVELSILFLHTVHSAHVTHNAAVHSLGRVSGGHGANATISGYTAPCAKRNAYKHVNADRPCTLDTRVICVGNRLNVSSMLF